MDLYGLSAALMAAALAAFFAALLLARLPVHDDHDHECPTCAAAR